MKKLELNRMPDLPFDVKEALNQLRINLGFCGDNIQTIMLTSSLPDEGKSFLSVQLWKMFAEVGYSTLLIDCDLRNSEMRSKYGIKGDGKIQGVVHYLSGKAALDDIVYGTNISSGYIIPNTTEVANPAILLESQRFGKMIDEMKKLFKYIIIDTPPLGNVADAMNIATYCDGTVLVIRSGETPRKLVYNSVNLLNRTETPLLGVVLNRVEIDSKAGYYNRYYHYGKYYKAYEKAGEK